MEGTSVKEPGGYGGKSMRMLAHVCEVQEAEIGQQRGSSYKPQDLPPTTSFS